MPCGRCVGGRDRAFGQELSSALTPMGFGPSGVVIALRSAKGRPECRAVSHVVIVPARLALPRVRTPASVPPAAPGQAQDCPFCPGSCEMWTAKMPRAALDCREAQSETQL